MYNKTPTHRPALTSLSGFFSLKYNKKNSLIINFNKIDY